MNRQMRRANGIKGPVEEPKRVRVASKGDVVLLEIVGETSKVTTHAGMSARLGVAVAIAVLKSSWLAWTHFGKWKAIKSIFRK